MWTSLSLPPHSPKRFQLTKRPCAAAQNQTAIHHISTAHAFTTPPALSILPRKASPARASLSTNHTKPPPSLHSMPSPPTLCSNQQCRLPLVYELRVNEADGPRARCPCGLQQMQYVDSSPEELVDGVFACFRRVNHLPVWKPADAKSPGSVVQRRHYVCKWLVDGHECGTEFGNRKLYPPYDLCYWEDWRENVSHGPMANHANKHLIQRNEELWNDFVHNRVSMPLLGSGLTSTTVIAARTQAVVLAAVVQPRVDGPTGAYAVLVPGVPAATNAAHTPLSSSSTSPSRTAAHWPRRVAPWVCRELTCGCSYDWQQHPLCPGCRRPTEMALGTDELAELVSQPSSAPSSVVSHSFSSSSSPSPASSFSTSSLYWAPQREGEAGRVEVGVDEDEDAPVQQRYDPVAHRMYDVAELDEATKQPSLELELPSAASHADLAQHVEAEEEQTPSPLPYTWGALQQSSPRPNPSLYGLGHYSISPSPSLSVHSTLSQAGRRQDNTSIGFFPQGELVDGMFLMNAVKPGKATPPSVCHRCDEPAAPHLVLRCTRPTAPPVEGVKQEDKTSEPTITCQPRSTHALSFCTSSLHLSTPDPHCCLLILLFLCPLRLTSSRR